MNSVKKNFLYNIAYQILMIIIPLITVPIVTRSLGATNLGIYSYTNSITNYFMLFGLLGISNYGNREVAKNRNNKNTLSITFWNIYTVQFVFSIIVLFIYIIYAIFLSNYSTIALIQVLFIISTILDINWFFFGIEKFKTTVTRNAIIKIISLLLIIAFVNNPSDLWKYTLILSFGTFLSQFVLWFFLFKEIDFVPLKKISIKEHLKGIFVLFIPVISYSIYKLMDKIMIGMFTDVSNVAFYENAEKIINVPTLVVAALGTVMMPRISNLISNNNVDDAKKYFNASIEFVFFFSIPVVFGLIFVGSDLCQIYLGNDFIKSGQLLQLLSVTVFFVSIANVVRTQYLIPMAKDKIYIISTVLGAVINFILNIILIQMIGVSGACIGTIVAEFVVMFYQIILTKKEINYTQYFQKFFVFCIKALAMSIIIVILKKCSLFKNDILNLFFIVIVSGGVYLLLNYRYVFNSILSLVKKNNKAL